MMLCTEAGNDAIINRAILLVACLCNFSDQGENASNNITHSHLTRTCSNQASADFTNPLDKRL